MNTTTTNTKDQTGAPVARIECLVCGWSIEYTASSPQSTRAAQQAAEGAAQAHARGCPGKRTNEGRLERERQRLIDLRMTLQQETVAMLAESVVVKQRALEAAHAAHARAVLELDRLRAARAAGGEL